MREPPGQSAALQVSSDAVTELLNIPELNRLSDKRRRHLSTAIGGAMTSSLMAEPVSAELAPVLALNMTKEAVKATEGNEIVWSRLLIALLALAAIAIGAIATEAAGLKGAPDNLWKIASAGIGSVIGILIGEGTAQ
jgi:hypothetical protein